METIWDTFETSVDRLPYARSSAAVNSSALLTFWVTPSSVSRRIGELWRLFSTERLNRSRLNAAPPSFVVDKIREAVIGALNLLMKIADNGYPCSSIFDFSFSIFVCFFRVEHTRGRQ